MFYCGNCQPLLQSQEVPRWWKTFSVTTKHPLFRANPICTALTRCVVQITRLLGVVRGEGEGGIRAESARLLAAWGSAGCGTFQIAPMASLLYGSSQLTCCSVCARSKSSSVPCFLEQQSKAAYGVIWDKWSGSRGRKRKKKKKKNQTLHLITKWKIPVACAAFVFTSVHIHYLLSHKI